jgi:plastocyanin
MLNSPASIEEGKMRKGLVGLVVAILIGGLVGPAYARATQAPMQAPYSYAGPVPLPDEGALFGAFVALDDHHGLVRRDAVPRYEAMIGRKLAIERVYYLWDEMFPTADDYWSRDKGRTLLLSWNTSESDQSTCAGRWAGIAAGDYDADIDARAEAIKAFAAPMFFTFHHEPTTAPPNHIACGTPDEYKAAWRYIKERFDADGVTNVTYVLILTALNYTRNKLDLFYAGDDVIDVLAADGYNWYSCEYHPGPWREMETIFTDFYNAGVEKGKPMVLGEYGSGEDDAVPGKKGQWFTNGADLFKKWPMIKGVTYFDKGTGGACDRYVDSSPSSLAGFSAMGKDPYFNPPVTTTAVSAADFAFTPISVTIPQGTVVKWTNNGPSNHTVTATKMDLFDSTGLPPGGTFSWVFTGAGTYPYECTIHPGQMTGAVKVKPTANPASGGVTTEFKITWAADLVPDGYAYDIQIKRPGGQWVDWKTLQKTPSDTFVPDGGVGRYQFRVRYHNTATDARSGYSPAVAIQVS